MIPAIEKIIGLLPPFKDERVLIKQNQRVDDIIKQLLIAHEKNVFFYDRFAMLFDDTTTLKICENICEFLKKYIKYVEESDKDQTTALPAAILNWRQGDCKHYASFTGGILDAINRETGKEIEWCYRFASYDLLSKSPHHVFVVVYDKGGEIWIDPVPGADKLTPVWQLDEYVNKNSMALTDVVGGIGDYEQSTSDSSLPPELSAAIELLLHYNVIDENANVNVNQLEMLLQELPPEESQQLSNAYELLYSNQSISGLFADIARAAKKVMFAAPRGAFLGLVALNFRSWAKNMNTAITDPVKGAENIELLRSKWYPLGGDWAQLLNAINDGKDKKQLGGVGVVVAATATTALATASAIVAIIIPLLETIMKNLPKNQGGSYTPIINPATGLPYTTTPVSSNNIMAWIKANPLPVVAALGIGSYLLLNDKKKVGKAKDYMPLYLIGGAALVFYLMKKAADKANEIPKENPLPVEELTNADPGNNPFTGASSYADGNAPFPVTIEQPVDNVVQMYGQEQVKSDYSFL